MICSFIHGLKIKLQQVNVRLGSLVLVDALVLLEVIMSAESLGASGMITLERCHGEIMLEREACKT